MNIKLIKNSLLTLSLLATTQLFANDLTPKKELLQDVKSQTKTCIVQIVSSANETENEKVLAFRSVCKTLKISSPTEAQIFIDGEWLTATIAESAESDGGDLDDLTIANSKGDVLATKTNIAAYDSVIVAMAGESNFKKIHSK